MNDEVFSKIQNKLILGEKYSILDSAIITANILTCYNPEIRDTIIDWAEGRDVSKFVLNESTVSDVADELSCSEFQALCFMNALTKDIDIYMDAILQFEKDDIRK